MIMVTRINGTEQFYVNEDRIEFLEATPDTVITLDSGKKVVVGESIDEIIDRIIEYKTRLYLFRTQGLSK